MIFFVFLIGLCVGSFVNMLKYRTAIRYGLVVDDKNRRSDLGGRSYCDFCGSQLTWWQNIPVISWLYLGGKSHCCHKKLPGEYPLLELGTGVMFGICFLFNGDSLWLGVNLVIVTLLIFSFVFDLSYMILPDFSSYFLIFVGLLWWNNWMSSIGAGVFLLILHIGTKGKGLGMGDVKLAFFMGLLLGWPRIVLAFYIAFIGGAVVGIGLMIMKKATRKTMIPFGPFLIVGTIVSWWVGDLIIKSIKLF